MLADYSAESVRQLADRSAGGILRKGRAIERSYWVVAAFFWLGLLIHTLGYQWGDDFRYHSAAIAEFAANPFSPRHVFLPSEIPHHSLSFYHQVWGIFASVTGLSPITVTQIAAMVNASALLAVFPFFVRVFLKHRHASAIALLVMLLAWGPDSWRFSSFLNLNSFGFSLPYPSYFATALSMLLVVLLDRVTQDRTSPSLPLVGAFAGLGFVISNAHLITFGYFMVLAVALVWSRRSRPGVVGGLGVVAGATAGAVLWPFFPLLGVVGESAVIDIQNLPVYRSTLVRLGPSLLGLIPLAMRFRRTRTDPLAVAFLVLLAIYLSGLVIDLYAFGRALALIALILQLALTEGILMVWERLREPRIRIGVGALGVLSLVLLAGLASPALVRMVPRAVLPPSIALDSRLDSPVEWIKEFDPLLTSEDIVLAPLTISEFFPVTGAKIVTLGPAPFVRDQEERVTDGAHFFATVDISIIEKYDVTWVAFREGSLPETTAQAIRALGESVEAKGVVLVDVRGLSE